MEGGSYINSPQNEKDDKFFQYAVTVALKYQNIKNNTVGYQKLSLLLINIIGK